VVILITENLISNSKTLPPSVSVPSESNYIQ